MKKLSAIMLAAAMLLALCACGGTQDKPDGGDVGTEDRQDANEPGGDTGVQPESGAQDEPDDGNGPQLPNPMVESTAEEIASRLGFTLVPPEGAEDVSYSIIDDALAQMRFTLSGNECVYRVCTSSELTDITGMYYEWEKNSECEIGGCAGTLGYNNGAEGVCCWYDTAPGIVYGLATMSGASGAGLIELAESLFTPMQGEADADADADAEKAEGDADAAEPVSSENAEQTTGEKVAALAVSLIGSKYEWGASGPETFDNSGFVYYCLKENGISVRRTTSEQYAGGAEVAEGDLKPGDLVFYTYEEDGSVSFVGIYVGDGKFVAENNEKSPACEHDMTLEHYTERFVGARRYA